jgi:hypothetical protein
MTAVVVALVGLGLLILLAAAVAWQEKKATADRSIVYGVEESIEFVRLRLSDDVRGRLKLSDIRRILEWSVRYLQDPEVRAGADDPPVAGGVEAARYVQERSLAAGVAYDGDLIIEVLRLQNEFLVSLGAVGEAIEPRDGDVSGGSAAQ